MKHTLANLLRTLLIATAIGFGVLATSPDAQACPNCKDSMSKDSEMARLGKAYSASVLLMLGVMGCLVAGFGGAAYFVIKRSNDMPTATPGKASTPDSHSDSPDSSPVRDSS